MWKSLLRPAMIFLPLGCGILLPEAHTLDWLIRWLLVFMFYLVCLQLRLRELKPTRTHWRLLAANLAMGVVPYWILHRLGYEDLALAAFFVGITPTANAAPVVIGFLHGRVGFVVTGFVITNLGIALALVGLLPWITGNYSWRFLLEVLQVLAIVMACPALLAAATRRVWPTAVHWPAKMSMVSFAAWSLTLFLIAADAAEFFRNHPDTPRWPIVTIALLALLLCGGNFLLGARLSPRRTRRESSQTLGQKNTTFTLYLALTFANPLVAMGPIFYVLWHNGWNAIQMFRHDRRFRNRPGRQKLKCGIPPQSP